MNRSSERLEVWSFPYFWGRYNTQYPFIYRLRNLCIIKAILFNSSLKLRKNHTQFFKSILKNRFNAFLTNMQGLHQFFRVIKIFVCQKIDFLDNMLDLLLSDCPCNHLSFNVLHKFLRKSLCDGIELIEDGVLKKLGLIGHKFTNFLPFISDGRNGILQTLATIIFIRILAIHP